MHQKKGQRALPSIAADDVEESVAMSANMDYIYADNASGKLLRKSDSRSTIR